MEYEPQFSFTLKVKGAKDMIQHMQPAKYT